MHVLTQRPQPLPPFAPLSFLSLPLPASLLQAVTFLVIGNKPKKTLDDITRDLCPVLSIQQLYRISTMYWDDKYNTETVSSEVRARAGIRFRRPVVVHHSSRAQAARPANFT